MPELAVSVTAALRGANEIAVGNVAVSYTHLDVYKRQAQKRAALAAIETGAAQVVVGTHALIQHCLLYTSTVRRAADG